MAETKKMTKKGYFEILRELVLDRPELVDFIDHEIELLTRKASKSGQTKTQKEKLSLQKTQTKIFYSFVPKNVSSKHSSQ